MRRRISNILIGLDQFMQVLVYLGNYTSDETISGIIGRKKKLGTMNWLEKAICWFLNKLQVNHCINNIDEEENIDGELI
jgi:hypothetical protein